jgi:hypothetical protein
MNEDFEVSFTTTLMGVEGTKTLNSIKVFVIKKCQLIKEVII